MSNCTQPHRYGLNDTAINAHVGETFVFSFQASTDTPYVWQATPADPKMLTAAAPVTTSNPLPPGPPLPGAGSATTYFSFTAVAPGTTTLRFDLTPVYAGGTPARTVLVTVNIASAEAPDWPNLRAAYVYAYTTTGWVMLGQTGPDPTNVQFKALLSQAAPNYRWAWIYLDTSPQPCGVMFPPNVTSLLRANVVYSNCISQVSAGGCSC